MPGQPTYHSRILDHLGLVAGMRDALGMGDVLDHATHQNTAMRDCTVRLITATAAKSLGIAPRFAHLESTALHVDGRYNSDAEPDEPVMHPP